MILFDIHYRSKTIQILDEWRPRVTGWNYFLHTNICSSSVWPDLAKNRHFGQILKVFVNFWNPHFALGNYWTYFVNFLCFWANFHLFKWPNIEKYFCHLVTLFQSHVAIFCKNLYAFQLDCDLIIIIIWASKIVVLQQVNWVLDDQRVNSTSH